MAGALLSAATPALIDSAKSVGSGVAKGVGTFVTSLLRGQNFKESLARGVETGTGLMDYKDYDNRDNRSAQASGSSYPATPSAASQLLQSGASALAGAAGKALQKQAQSWAPAMTYTQQRAGPGSVKQLLSPSSIPDYATQPLGTQGSVPTEAGGVLEVLARQGQKKVVVGYFPLKANKMRIVMEMLSQGARMSQISDLMAFLDKLSTEPAIPLVSESPVDSYGPNLADVLKASAPLVIGTGATPLPTGALPPGPL